jgi:hypothetical protein
VENRFQNVPFKCNLQRYTTGYKLASLRLPAPPIAPATIADVNGDGLNDLILRTKSGVYCWQGWHSLPGVTRLVT